MNYHHLRYFWAVAKAGGLTHAARKLHVSQPTICAQVQALEGALGEKLFRRRGRRLELTAAGEQALSYAEEIFSLGEDFINSMKARPTTRPLRVRIGIADTLPKLVSYEIIKPVFRLAKAVQASCQEAKVMDLLGQLATYRLDVVLADEPAPGSLNLKAFNHLLGEGGILFCAAARLARRLEPGFPGSLHDAPVLLPSADTVLRRSLESWFQRQSLRPRLVAEFDDTALMRVAGTEGLGFFPLSSLVADNALNRQGLRVIGQAEGCSQQFFAISAERRLTHPAVVAITSGAISSLFSGRPGSKTRRRSPSG